MHGKYPYHCNRFAGPPEPRHDTADPARRPGPVSHRPTVIDLPPGSEFALIIVADRNMATLENTFGRHGALRLADGRALRRETLEDADVLLVRSVTRVDAALLEGTPVRFVGTATIGTDHLDLRWLEAHGIAWASAPGCNADAAAQYTLGMILLAWHRLGRARADLGVGIVGHGNVGSRLAALCEALGVPTVSNDPPLAEAGLGGLVILDEALACPVVSLHVPLTRSGPWPTAHLVDGDVIERMAPGALLVNAARGDVVDGDALTAALAAGRIHAALDVWPGEPRIDSALLHATTVATPHVAGYSTEGKRRGTTMVYDAFCRWLGVDMPAGAPERTNSNESLDVRGHRDPIARAVLETTGVERDDAALRAAPCDVKAFDRLRRACGPRREFAQVRVRAPRTALDMLCALGFDTPTAAMDRNTPNEASPA